MKTEFPVELLTELGRESAEMLLKDQNFWVQKKLDAHRRQFELLTDGTLLSYNRNGESVRYPNLKYKTTVSCTSPESFLAFCEAFRAC